MKDIDQSLGQLLTQLVSAFHPLQTLSWEGISQSLGPSKRRAAGDCAFIAKPVFSSRGRTRARRCGKLQFQGFGKLQRVVYLNSQVSDGGSPASCVQEGAGMRVGCQSSCRATKPSSGASCACRSRPDPAQRERPICLPVVRTGGCSDEPSLASARKEPVAWS